MDVRQYAFLARLPSATVQPRESFCGIPKRALAFLLANVMFWQPIWAQADGIAVSAGNTGLAQAGNGVPIVNIAAPNANGLSHNQFKDYNVDSKGLILNNATDRTQNTQLGGIIVGNPNFSGRAADIILNEVNGGSPSQLRGYTEVAGKSAHVIVANPYGIACDGCGFINTPRVTLSTGKPIIDNGQLSRYQVDQGNVAIQGAGLNATNVDQFEIITRATQINAQLQANKLDIVAGRNDVDARTLAATARAADGSQAPELAIDSSALGGMYVNTIRLVGTEAGVGVKLAGDMMAGGDIQIDANGKLSTGQMSAGGSATVKAREVDAQGTLYAGQNLAISAQGDVTNRQSLAARDSLSIDSSGKLTNQGVIEAGVNADNSRNAQGDLRISAQAIDNSGRTLAASRDLSVETGALANQGGTLSAGRNARVDAGQLDNQNRGRILAGGDLSSTSQTLLNAQGGLLSSGAALSLNSGNLINRNGELSASGQVTLRLASLDNVAGLVSAGQGLDLYVAALLNNSGGGQISSRQQLTASVGSLDQQAGGRLRSDAGMSLDLRHGQLDNRTGVINAAGQLTLDNLAGVDNRQGEISSQRAFTVAASSLDNTAGKLLSDQALTLSIAGALNNAAGLIAAQALQIDAASLFNGQQGTLSSRGTLAARVSGALDNHDGNLSAQGAMQIAVGSLDNSAGRLHGQSGISLDLNHGHWNNQAGLFTAPGQLQLFNLASIANQGGEISSALGFELHGDSLDNRGGKLQSDASLGLVLGGGLDNREGRVTSAATLALNAGSLDNRLGTLTSSTDLHASLAGNLLNQSGLFSAGSHLQLSAVDLINHNGQLTAGATLQLRTAQLDNRNAGRILGSELDASVTGLAQSAGSQLYGKDALTLDLNNGHLDNQAGLISTPGQMLLRNLATVDNRTGEISGSRAFLLAASQLDNRGGKLLGDQLLTLRIAGALDNAAGLVSAARLDGRSASLNNQGGKLSAAADLLFSAEDLLDNRNGELLARELELNAASLDNAQGTLFASERLALALGGTLNNEKGTVRAERNLALHAGQVDNVTGGRISAGERLTASVTGLDQRGDGQLLGQGSLALDLNNGHLNNQGGRLNALGQLQLDNFGSVDNRNGEVSSNLAFVLAATTLDNGSGKLLSEQGLTLRIARLLDNTRGLVSAPSLDIRAGSLTNQLGSLSAGNAITLQTDGLLDNREGKVLAGSSQVSVGGLDNRQGLLQADRGLAISSRTGLDNRQGTLHGGQGVELQGASLDNSGGKLESDGYLNARIAGQMFNQAGLFSSAGDLSLSVAALGNTDGRLYSQAGVTLDLNHGYLDNQRGLVNAPGQLLLRNLGSVDNRGGEISSKLAFELAATDLDNRAGKLLGEQGLTLRIARALDNAAGLVSAARIDGRVGSLGNAGGKLEARDTLLLSADGLLDNTRGELLARDLSLAAATLDNRTGRAQGDNSLAIADTGAVLNAAGNLSAKQLAVNAASLDNAQGTLFASEGLALSLSGTLNNAKGILRGDRNLELRAGQVANTDGGRISASEQLTASVSGLDQHGDGQLLSQGGLTLDLNHGHLNNQGGRINAPGQLLLNNLGTVDNRNAEISSNLAFLLAAGALDNGNGRLLSEQGLTLRIARLLDNSKGQLSAPALNIQVGRLLNHGGSLSAGNALTLAVDEALDNRDGEVLANNATLSLGSLDNRLGLLQADSGLELASSGALDNRQGTLYAGQRLGVGGASLDNAAGRLSSLGSVTLDLNNGRLNNQDGLINAPGQLLLRNLGEVDNQRGEISSQLAFELAATQLDNGNGKLLSEQDLTLRIARALLNGHGRIGAAGVGLHAGSLDNREGLVEARNGLTLAIDGMLGNQQGKLLGAQTSVTSQALGNERGLIQGDASLVLTQTAELLNSDGQLLAGQHLSLAAGSLDNTRGSLTSDGRLDVQVSGQAVNQHGLLAAKGAADLTLGSLDNREAGRISSQANLVLRSGDLDNRGGILAAEQGLKLHAGQVNNGSGGRINSTGQLDASVSGLDQQNDGQLFSQGGVSLDLNAGLLDNRGGRINAPGQLLLNNLGSVDNRGGEISSQLAFLLAAGALDNGNGKLLSEQGLTLRIARLLDNTRGLVSAPTLDIRAGSLVNQSGSLSSAGAISLVVDAALDNQGGKLLADSAVVRAGSLDNRLGLVQSDTRLDLTSAGSVDNRQGTLFARQGANLGAASLSNSDGGRLYGLADVSLDLNGGHLDNQHGLINAPGQLLLNNLGSVANLDGEISSTQAFELAANRFDNGGKLLSEQSLTLRIAQTLDNTKGLIKAAALDVQAGSLLNRQGKLEAGNGLTLRVDSSLDNQQGELLGTTTRVTSITLNNDAGLIQGDKRLNLDLSGAASNAGGRLLAGEALGLNVASLDNNLGRVASDGTLEIAVTGQLLNRDGLLGAVGVLQLSAASLDNQLDGLVSSLSNLTLDATRFDNRGGSVIASGQLQVRGSELDNRQAGLLNSGGAMTLEVHDLDNRAGKITSVSSLTASGNRLDNSGGGRVGANGALQLTLARLDNQNKGMVSGQQSVSITANQIDNAAQGSLYGKTGLSLLLRDGNGLAGQLDNTRGVLRSDAGLGLDLLGLVNDSGRITSASTLLVTAGQGVSNLGGEILGSTALTLTSLGLANSGGRIAADGRLQITTGTLSNQGGRLTSADRFDLSAAQVDNRSGRIASAKALTASVSGLDQRNGGELYSNSALTLDLNNGVLDNSGGLINAPGPLLLRNLAAVHNRGGEISSEQGFDLSAESLDNSGGDLLSDAAIGLIVRQALLNIGGQIAADGLSAEAGSLNNSDGLFSSSANLELKVAGALLNDGGEVSGAGTSLVRAASLGNGNGQVMSDIALDLGVTGALLNQGGTLGAGRQLQVAAGSLDNSHTGSLVSDGSLGLNVTGLLDNQGGSLLAKGVMDLLVGSLDNRGGRLSGQNALTLRGTRLDNRDGVIRANQDLLLRLALLDNRNGLVNGVRGLDLGASELRNQAGLISASGLVRLDAANANNSKGRIASQADLVATVGVLEQQGGELVAQGELSLSGERLDNSANGLVGSSKALKLEVADTDNRGGAISSQLGVNVKGTQLDNSGGKLLAGTRLEVSVTRAINQAKGLLFAQDVNLDAGRLDNGKGTVAAQRGLMLSLSGDLDNAEGSLSSEGSLSLTGKQLDNRAGSISSAGLLTLKGSAGLLNQGGVVESAQALNLTSASLDNGSQGLIKSQGDGSVVTGRFDNSLGGRLIGSAALDLTAGQVSNGGRIASTGALTASFGGLVQQQGELFSNTRLSLDLNGGELTNLGLINAPNLVLSNLGAVSNPGEISSQNAFTLAALSLDNGLGKLVSNQGLTLRIEQLLGNVGGRISAASLDLGSLRLDNSNGLVSSRDALTLVTGDWLRNQGGTLVADGQLGITSASLDNRQGEIAGKALVALHGGDIDNQAGQLIGTEQVTVNAASLDNRGGLLGATKALKLEIGSVDNRGGELTGNSDVTLTGQRLDNSDGGVIFAAGSLTLTVQSVLNRARGQLNGKSVSLGGASLDNNGGGIFAQLPLVLAFTGDLDNRQGTLSSESTLNLSAASVDNSAGSLGSAGALPLSVTNGVNNSDGELVTDGALVLRSGGLDNSRGSLSAKGAVSVTTGILGNSGGRLNSAQTLDLTASQLNNGGSIGSLKALTASLGGLDQQGGKLSSNTALSLDLNGGRLDNQGGLINTAGPLLFSNLGDVGNRNGEISSAQAFTLAARSLDNDNGRLLSNQALNLVITQALSNLKGLAGAASLGVSAGSVDNREGILNSRGDLQLTSSGLLDNRQQGLVSAAGVLTLTSGDLHNQAGSLLGASAATLTVRALNNSAAGLINSQGGLQLRASSLDSSGGEVSARSNLSLDLGSLLLAGGRIVGDHGVTLDLNGNDLSNTGGLILAKGALTFDRVGAFSNAGGELSTQQSLTLNASSLDNSNGKLIGVQRLILEVGSINNQHGLLSGWQGLSLHGGSLDNRNLGTLSSREGALDVQLTGALLNGGEGALVSLGRMDIGAASLDNAGGVLSSGAALHMAVGSLGNQDGSIDAQQWMTLTGTDLDNSNGRIAGNGSLVLDLDGTLTNTAGEMVSTGSLLLKQAQQVINQRGTFVSRAGLELNAGTFDNSQGGVVAARDQVKLVASSVLRNDAAGQVFSENADVRLQAAELLNQQGQVQGQTGLVLDIAGALNNRNGTLVARSGNLVVQRAGSLGNQAGVLASVAGLVDLSVSGVLDNSQAGVVQGQQLQVLAGTLDNSAGRMAAQTGDVRIRGGNLINAGGGLFAKGLVRVDGLGLNNNNGQLAGNRIELALGDGLSNRSGVIESDTHLLVSASAVDNQGGQLRALGGAGKSDFQVRGGFDNRNGTLEVSSADLTLNAAGLSNVGGAVKHGGTGTFDIATSNVINSGGTLVTRGGLTLTADSWTNSSVIQAGRLTLNINTLEQTAGAELLASESLVGTGVNWNNAGKIISDGSASLNLSSIYQGSGRYSALGDLGLSAGQITLGSASSIAGGAQSTVQASSTLINAGHLTSAGNLNLSAGTLNNTGTLGAGQQLLVSAGTLVNERGLIYSGADMQLLASTFTNRYAQVYSFGSLLIGADQAGGKMSLLDNRSSGIESGGQMTLAATTLNNVRDVLEYSQHEKTETGIERLSCTLIPVIGCDRRNEYQINALWVINETDRLQILAQSEASNIGSGTNLLIEAGKLTNSASSISAAGNLSVTASTIENQGVQAQEIKTSRRVVSYVRETAAAIQLADIFNQRNNPTPSATYESDLANFLRSTYLHLDETSTVLNGSTLDAVIQAGGNITLNATQNINNSVVRPWYSYVAAGAKTAETGAGSAYSTAVSINSQLPPNLAQQYINPLSLPGVQLPDENGSLYRLSKQDASAGAVAQGDTGPRNWTLGAASIDLNQREQAAPVATGRTLTLDDVTQLTADSRQVSVAAREARDVGATIASINVTALGSVSNDAWQSGRSEGSALTRADGIGSQGPAGDSSGSLSASGQNIDLSGIAGERDTRVDVTNPGGNTPGLSTGPRDTTVGVSQQGPDLGIPGLTPGSRDTRIDVAGQHVPGLSTGSRDTTVAGQNGGPDFTLQQRTDQPIPSTPGASTDPALNVPGLSATTRDTTLDGQAATARPDLALPTRGDQSVVQAVPVPAPGAQPHDAVIPAAERPDTPAIDPRSTAVNAPATSQPTAAAGQTIERAQGVPERTAASQPHKYLIETNPVLTELKQFMSSDYLLSGLGYNPDDSAKRLGDGFYEQHLIQQAIVAGAGQRFIAGMTSNEQMFKYLMDNAIASKQQLALTVGVSLTAEQVAALTHDIVWLEEMQVNGEAVLVPVLYMANANNRLAVNGALIAGTDVNLIAGQDLLNVGTLRASNNLSAMAGNDLVNSGLIEAANRVDLLAGNNIVHKAGGIISGRDVSLPTVLGDVINERSVTSHISGDATNNGRRDFLDSAARIEAANDLSINAGQDILNQGGVLQSGRDLGLQAGRDVLLGSTEAINSASAGGRSSQSIQQNGSSVTAGRDFSAVAGRDFTAIASQIEAQRDIDISATGDVTLMSAADEEHSSYTSKKLKTQDDHVSQVSTTLKAGGDVAVSAGQDLALIASRITAGDEAYLFAGDNIRMTTADNLDYSYYEKTKKGSFGKKKSTMSETEADVSVSSSVSAGTKLVISAGEDFNATGAKLNSDGALLVTAGGDINFDAAQDYASQANASSKKSWTSAKSSSSEVTQTRLNGTELLGASIELKADNDILLKAASLRAEEGVKLIAGNDVLIGAAQETQTSAQSQGSSKAGYTFTGWFSATQKSQQSQSTSGQSIGSAISADSIQIRSGSDTTVEGSTLVADRNIDIDAGGNLEITSAENTETSSSKSGSKQVGEVGTSWWQGATGILKQKQADEYSADRQSGSQIASLGGNINLTAGDHYTQTASQLVAPEGDIGITARHVDIQAGYDSMEYSKTTSASRTAIGGTVSIPLLDALRNIQQMGEAAQKTDDGRMLALAAVNAAMSANQALEAGQALMEAPEAGIKLSVNLSDSRSQSESSQSGRNVVSSDVVAGGDVKIVATGDGANSDINGIGSRIEGGGDVVLKADGDINLVAAQNTAHQDSTNRNSGWSAGIGIGFGGAQNGISFELAANAGRGMADGDDVTQTNTYIKGGNSVKLESGGDTTLKGGVVSAEQVKVKVGGDLNIESLQDTSTYTSRQMSASVGVNICVPPFCVGMSSISGGLAAQHMQSDYASVNEQSGIKAGNGGFQVEVAGNTDLKGAIIASTDKAVADGKNTLETGTLTTSAIKNKAEYDASSINLSGGYGGEIGVDGKGNANATANANGPTAPSKGGLSVNTPVVLYAGDSSSSTTESGISGAAVTITNAAGQMELTGQTVEQTVAGINTDVSSDRDGSNKLKPIFDAQEISVNFEIVGKFVQNVSQYIASRAQEIDQKKEQAEKERLLMNAPGMSEADQLKHHSNYQALNQEIRDLDENWGAGGTYRQIATALVAGVSGNVAGSGGQFAQNMVVNYVQQQGSAYIGELVKKGLKEGSPEHAALHAIVGCAGAAASNQGCSSGALGGAASSVLAGLFAEADANETAVEREAKRNLITSLVTGIAAMSDPNGAATANNAATANIDNNWLSTQQYVQYQKELEEAQGTLDHLKVIAKWSGTSVKQDALTAGGIGLGLAESGLQDIKGLAQFLSDPITGLQGIAAIVSDREVRNQLGEEVTASLLGSIERMELALEVGGDDHAVQLGRDLGALLYTVGGVLTAVGGATRAGLSLAKTGVEVSSKALGQMAIKDSQELGVRVAALETKTTKSLDVVTDGKGAGAKGPATGLPSGETKVVGGSPSTDVPKTPSEQVAQNSKGTDLPDKKPETNPQNHPEEPKKDKGPCCFAAGTMVATPAGDRAIETLKIGDVVWTKPEHGGEPFASTVVKTFQRNDQPIYKLTLESTRTSGDVKQEILFVTPSHPFYVPARRDFVPMIELRAGDLLQSLADGATENTSSRVAGVELFKPVGQTYNLTVDVGHTFYVGELKTWVHNEGECDPAGGSAKNPGKVDPPTPKVDVANEFAISVFKDGGVELRYGNPDGVAGLVVNVNKEGVLGFDIRAAQNHPLYEASGTDMFASAMQRLESEGVQVNKIRGAWVQGSDSVNTAQYMKNIASGMSKEDAALNTWTGQISQRYGYGKVDKIETVGEVIYVIFKK